MPQDVDAVGTAIKKTANKTKHLTVCHVVNVDTAVISLLVKGKKKVYVKHGSMHHSCTTLTELRSDVQLDQSIPFDSVCVQITKIKDAEAAAEAAKTCYRQVGPLTSAGFRV